MRRDNDCIEQQNQSNTTFSKTVICAGVTSMVLVVYGTNIVRGRYKSEKLSVCMFTTIMKRRPGNSDWADNVRALGSLPFCERL